jgi:hypothetical protein
MLRSLSLLSILAVSFFGGAVGSTTEADRASVCGTLNSVEAREACNRLLSSQSAENIASIVSHGSKRQVAPGSEPGVSGTATYRLTFTGKWTLNNNPSAEFPDNPSFSELIAASHEPGKHVMFNVGSLISDGGEVLAEKGDNDELRDELKDRSAVLDITRGDGSVSNTGVEVLELEVDATHSAISFMTMIAPSPDWFTGLDSYALRLANQWATDATILVNPYDAGTDNGNKFTSSNQNQVPQKPVSKITDPTIFGSSNADVGTIRIQCIAGACLPP